MKPYRAYLFFFLGLVCLSVAFFLLSAFLGFFNTSAILSQNNNSNTDTNQTTDYDPYVTVVPKEVLGGKPQVLATDPQRGAVDPKVTIVEFGDFECGDCAQLKEVIDKVTADYPDQVTQVWKDDPLPAQHPHAEDAAQAARCAQDQGAFWDYRDLLFARQTELGADLYRNLAQTLNLNQEQFSQCLQDRIHENLVVQGYFIAQTLEIVDTPAYYINNEEHSGVPTYEELKAKVETALAQNQN